MLTHPTISPGKTRASRIVALPVNAPAPPRKPRPRILLVDDDSSVRESICRVLTAEALQVVMARGVKDALEHIFRSPPDLVITDLCMAPLSGWDLILHLGNHHPTLPILVVTALPLQSAGGADRDVAEYFQKPLDLDALLAAIRRQLGARGNPPVSRKPD